MKLLDCTLRDGGYQTNWHFSGDLVKKYFAAMENSGVEYLEIGFRFPKHDNTYGPFAYVDNNLIDSLNISEKFKLGIMINIADFIMNGQVNLNLLREVFKNEIDRIHFVRIATLSLHVESVVEVAYILREMGFDVHVNLMQISELNSNEIEVFCKKMLSFMNSLTIADTFGVLQPKDVNNIYKIIRNTSKINIGIHAHDNCGLALANSLEAIDLGFEFIDSTVSGIGRAAGNLRTEFISQFVDKNNQLDLKRYESLFNLANIDFAKLNHNNSWGPNLIYFIGSQLRIHPNNLMSIVKEQSNVYSEVLPLFSFPTQDFSGIRTLQKSVSQNSGIHLGKDFMSDKDVFLLGSGPFLDDYKVEVQNVLNKSRKQGVVFATNLDSSIDLSLVNYFIILDEKKFKFQYEKNPDHYDHIFKKYSHKIISPYPLDISDSESILSVFPFSDEDTDKYFEKSLHYALLIFKFGQAATINLLGFDGYEKDFRRNELIQKCLNYFSDKEELGGRIFAGTPTRYDVPKKSFFA